MPLGRIRNIPGREGLTLRDINRTKPVNEPNVFFDTATRPAAEKNKGRIIFLAGTTNAIQYSDGTQWVSLSLGGLGGAPVAAQYIVAAAHASLTAERVATDTSTVAWDFGTPAQAKANVPNDSITYAKIQNISAASKLLGRGSAGGSGDTEEITLGSNLSMSGTTLNASGGAASNLHVITVESPTDTENIPVFIANAAITISAVYSFLRGSASPSLTWNFRHGTDPSAAGADLFTSAQVTTSTSSITTDNSGFSDATLASGEALWLVTSSKSGTVTQGHWTVEYS